MREADDHGLGMTTREAAEAIAKVLAQVMPEAPFATQERLALEVTNEAVREFIRERLQSLADEFRGDVECNGKHYRHHQEGTVAYHTLCGPVEIMRPTARLSEERNGPTIVPMELAAGIAERCTPALAYALVHGYATEGSREIQDRLAAACRLPPSRATIERVASDLAALAVEQQDVVLRGLRRAEELPTGTTGLCLGIDRASTPMREEVPDGQSRPEPKRKTPRVRRAPLPYDVVFRMSYVVTLAYLDANGETLAARRYAAPAGDDPTTVVSRAAEDIRAALTKKKKESGQMLTLGLVQDGAPEMWNLGRDALQDLVDDKTIPEWFEALDRCHLMGRLGSALDILGIGKDERDDVLDDWSRRLDRQDSAIDGIETWLKNRAAEGTPSQRDALAEHLTYINNNKDRMRYVTMLNRGLPVGSGVTESAAKTIINARTKRSGQRWTEDGLRGVLALRGLLQSRRLPAFWRSLSRRFVANVTCAEAA